MDLIRFGKGFGDFELAGKGGGETDRERHHPALVALGLMDMESRLSQIEVFDTQVEGFSDPEPAGVEQMNNQPGRVAMNIGYRGEQLQDLGLGRAVAKRGWTIGAEGLDRAEWLFEHFPVKEEQGIEGLVLGGGRNVGLGEVGEEGLDLLFRGGVGVFETLEKEGVAPEPLGVGFLGADREMFSGTSLVG